MNQINSALETSNIQITTSHSILDDKLATATAIVTTAGIPSAVEQRSVDIRSSEVSHVSTDNEGDEMILRNSRVYASC
jgi:hypothetical protein